MTLIGKFIEFKGQFLDSAINQPFKIVKFKLSKTKLGQLKTRVLQLWMEFHFRC